jgi:hypothetical protein
MTAPYVLEYEAAFKFVNAPKSRNRILHRHNIFSYILTWGEKSERKKGRDRKIKRKEENIIEGK